MIELINVNKSFFRGKANQIDALRDVNLRINDGDMISIMGPSGSGKSTLLHILATLDDADSGEYTFDDERIDKMNDVQKAHLRNNAIGVVLQEYGLIGEMTAVQNVEIPLVIAGIRAREARKRAKEALRQVGMLDKASQKTSLLSGGQRQRVAIARALVTKAKIIFADEPTGALDSKTSLEIVDLLSALNQAGITIVIVTHDIHVAERCARQIKIIDGKITM